ncbi:MAG: penicillin-binding protein 2 [Coriobacteriia bacterium]|nr:penicillin-binding protein 2 [Coriobacteriia bacterium]
MEDKIHFPTDNRIKIVIGVFLVVVIIVFFRLIWLQIIDAEPNKKAAIESRTVTYTTNPKRGTIYDRNGNVLAFSKEAKTIYANPSEIENVDSVAKDLSSELGGKIDDYKDLINDKNKKFVYIKRRLDIDKIDGLESKKIKGIYLIDDTKREYPYGEIAGQIVGTCNIDGDGLCGLELQYDDILRGSKGTTVVQQGQAGMPIPGGKVQETESVDGQDLMISIDIELQQKMQEYVAAYDQKISAESTHALVMDPTNGEIYAACSTPYLNPKDTNNIKQGATELRPISSTFEPGSTFKTVSASALLENNAVKPEEEFNCPSDLFADGYYVSDAHKRGAQTFTFKQIIERSSNVGISLATERMGFVKFYDKIIKYQFDEAPGTDFPGDTKGYISPQEQWSKIQSYNVTFGQGITVTPMQMTRFYSALANNGYEVTPHFLMRYLQTSNDVEYESKDVIENKNSIPITVDLLKSVVDNGTGEYARIDGYGVAGKTGTGEIADSNGKYLSGIYYNSFIGFLSQATQPLICYVGGQHVPSEIAMTPLFKDIMKFAIERFKISPKG